MTDPARWGNPDGPGARAGAESVLRRCPIVPVVVVDDPDGAEDLAAALLRGGIDVVEVTLRTPAAVEVIERMAAVPDLLVGAGTVLTPEHATRAVGAGARFLVSPGLSAATVRAGLASGVSVLPGVATSSELMAAMELGLDEVKFFPAGLLGGARAVRALAGPFPQVSFLPSGGIGADTMGDYLALPQVPAVGGSWIADAELLRRRDWAQVTERAAAALVRARRIG